MRLIMNAKQLQTTEQANQFLERSEALELRGLTSEEKYRLVEEVLIRLGYHVLREMRTG